MLELKFIRTEGNKAICFHRHLRYRSYRIHSEGPWLQIKLSHNYPTTEDILGIYTTIFKSPNNDTIAFRAVIFSFRTVTIRLRTYNSIQNCHNSIQYYYNFIENCDNSIQQVCKISCNSYENAKIVIVDDKFQFQCRISNLFRDFLV